MGQMDKSFQNYVGVALGRKGSLGRVLKIISGILASQSEGTGHARFAAGILLSPSSRKPYHRGAQEQWIAVDSKLKSKVFSSSLGTAMKRLAHEGKVLGPTARRKLGNLLNSLHEICDQGYHGTSFDWFSTTLHIFEHESSGDVDASMLKDMLLFARKQHDLNLYVA